MMLIEMHHRVEPLMGVPNVNDRQTMLSDASPLPIQKIKNNNNNIISHCVTINYRLIEICTNKGDL